MSQEPHSDWVVITGWKSVSGSLTSWRHCCISPQLCLATLVGSWLAAGGLPAPLGCIATAAVELLLVLVIARQQHPGILQRHAAHAEHGHVWLLNSADGITRL
jgi:hypothetical protein